MSTLSEALKQFKVSEFGDFNVYKWLTKMIYEKNRDDLKSLKADYKNLSEKEIAIRFGIIDGREDIINLIDIMSKEDT